MVHLPRYLSPAMLLLLAQLHQDGCQSQAWMQLQLFSAQAMAHSRKWMHRFDASIAELPSCCQYAAAWQPALDLHHHLWQVEQQAQQYEQQQYQQWQEC
jgi:hypothetical protein